MDFSTIKEVNCGNIVSIWPELKRNMNESTFIAIDTEMSGLGDNSLTFQSNADDKYAAMKTAAQTRSIISLGITCFKHLECENEENCEVNNNAENPQNIAASVRYFANSYNILVLCCDSFCIDPSAVSFLVRHGFDFNLQFAKGLKYRKGSPNLRHKNINESPTSARKIFNELIRVRKPIVFHNGLADLVFLYECFYAPCPIKLSTFLSDVSEMFPSGIYDTKVIAHIHEKLNSTFLEYICKIYQVKNNELASKHRPYVCISLNEGKISVNDILGPCPNQSAVVNDIKICTNYAKYGWCKNSANDSCKFSHNVTDVIEHELSDKIRKRNKRKHSCDVDTSGPDPKLSCMLASVEQSDEINLSSSVRSEKLPRLISCHRAGMDSLLTGYSFAVFIISRLKKSDLEQIIGSKPGVFSSSIPYLSDSLKSSLFNKVHLNGRNIPLWITKSHFAKTSPAHEDNILKIFLE